MFDPNVIASRVLRQCLGRATRFEETWLQDYRRAWRKARSEARKRPAPRVKMGPRVQYPKLSPEELSKVGDIDGLL